MRRKQLKICVISILIMGLINTFLIHNITKKQEYNQYNLESELPYKLATESEGNPTIRVLIKSSNYKNLTHNQVKLSSESGLQIIVGEDVEKYDANETITIHPDAPFFEDGNIKIKPLEESGKIKINNLERSQGVPSYRGTLELFSTAEGIVIVNELLLEEYLCAVVPSEMPSSYELEALKVQAICARSYAHCQMKKRGYPEYNAHVDDSTSYQVYGNYKEAESTTKAINETAGEMLWYKNNVARTYFYSTSAGHSTSVEAWGTKLTEKNAYLKGVELCDSEGTPYEKELPWYRWTVEITKGKLQDLIESNTGKNIGTLKNISVLERGTGEIAKKLEIQGTESSINIETENEIRRVLGGGDYKIKKQDGTVIDSMSLLPSAFFTIEKNDDNYIIKGGGYGHGIGMSQNGANEMAKSGMTYEEILEFFYPGTKVK